MKEHVQITLEKSVLESFDDFRGLVPRSAYINSIIKEKIGAAGSIRQDTPAADTRTPRKMRMPDD